jgi:hypothetical protein
MKKIMTFENYLVNELNLGTYRDIIKMGIERGDSRGREIAINARELLYRDYKGKEVSLRIDDSSSKGYTEHTIKLNPSIKLDGQPDSHWDSFFSKNGKVDNILITLNLDEEPDVMVEVKSLSSNLPSVVVHVGKYGSIHNVEFDRKSTKLLSKMVEEYSGHSIQSSIFKQF